MRESTLLRGRTRRPNSVERCVQTDRCTKVVLTAIAIFLFYLCAASRERSVYANASPPPAVTDVRIVSSDVVLGVAYVGVRGLAKDDLIKPIPLPVGELWASIGRYQLS